MINVIDKVKFGPSNRSLTIIYWATTLISSIAFFVTGVGNLIPFEHIAKDMSNLGYPPYFLKILGAWKILGAITIVFVRIPWLKQWAYAGMFFDLTGAAYSRYASGDSGVMVIVPIGIVSFVAISRALQPKEDIPAA